MKFELNRRSDGGEKCRTTFTGEGTSLVVTCKRARDILACYSSYTPGLLLVVPVPSCGLHSPLGLDCLRYAALDFSEKRQSKDWRSYRYSNEPHDDGGRR